MQILRSSFHLPVFCTDRRVAELESRAYRTLGWIHSIGKFNWENTEDSLPWDMFSSRTYTQFFPTSVHRAFYNNWSLLVIMGMPSCKCARKLQNAQQLLMSRIILYHKLSYWCHVLYYTSRNTGHCGASLSEQKLSTCYADAAWRLAVEEQHLSLVWWRGSELFGWFW